MSVEPAYFHFTCRHGHDRIGEAGTLLPACQLTDVIPEAWWPSRFVWLTDLPVPPLAALGFQRQSGGCDHLAHRYRVTDASTVRAWTQVRRGLVRTRSVLEDLPGVKLRHWYVSTLPVPVVLDDVRVYTAG